MKSIHSFITAGLVLAVGAGVGACGGEDFAECSEESGTACTWAGVPGQRGYDGGDKDRRASWLYFPVDITFAPDGHAWIVDYNNHRLRRVQDDQTLHSMVGTAYEGDGSEGETDRLPVGDPVGAPGNEVALNHPTDLEFLDDGTAIFAAWHNNKIRVMSPDGIVKVLTGNSYGYAGDGGPAAEAVLFQPSSVVVDDDRNVYLIDQVNERIRHITSIDDAEPMISTLAGNGEVGYTGDGATIDVATFHFDNAPTPQPTGALALRGRELFIADTLNHRVRHIDLDTGEMKCIAGTGVAGYAGDGGDALEAELNYPNDIEFGPDGRLYVADQMNNAIRVIDVETGLIETAAGTATPCPNPAMCIEAEEGLPAAQVQLNQPSGLDFDAEGNMYIADQYNQRIVRIAR